MGRHTHHRKLAIWMNGVRVGEWTISQQGYDELTYDPAWLQSPRARPLSLSLPLQSATIRSSAVGAYFDNLLPDSEPIRKRIQARFAIPGRSAFDLLEAIGLDCVGAVQLLPVDATPADHRHVDVTPLTEGQIAQVLRDTTLPSGGLFREDRADFRISIAGAQEKTALTLVDGRWCLPKGMTPTTHIFKLPLGLVSARKADMRTSVENEWLCAQLLRAYEVPVAETAMGLFEDQKAMIVTRFDRQYTTGYWLRLPQEDFCQVMGRSSIVKYESDGGPGQAEIIKKLLFSRNVEQDLVTFFRSQLIFWMLAATDGHAKNFSLRLLPGAEYELTPLYDVLSAWPVIGRGPNLLDYKELKLAMALHSSNTHYLLANVQDRHFLALAEQCRFTRDTGRKLIDEILSKTPAVLAQVEALLPRDFPMDVFESIAEGLTSSANRLAASARLAEGN